MAAKRNRVEAIGYLRTSSAANVGDGKDSEARQRKAIDGYATTAGCLRVYTHSPRMEGPNVGTGT
jgi:hypothetical protein